VLNLLAKQKKGFKKTDSSTVCASTAMGHTIWPDGLVGLIAFVILHVASATDYFNTSYSFGRCYDEQR
jgi:hypothetical protein